MTSPKHPPRPWQTDELDTLQERAEAGPRPEDAVDEASLESFPASDPPSFTPTHAGAPAEHPDVSTKRHP